MLSNPATRAIDPMFFQCWASAVGGGPILKQRLVKFSCLLGIILNYFNIMYDQVRQY